MAAPMGERAEIRPLRGSDSDGPTIRKVDFPEPSSTTTAGAELDRDGRVAPSSMISTLPEQLLEGLDPALGERLLASSLLVLRVLAQVAQLACGLDAGHDGRSGDGRQLEMLRLHGGQAAGRHPRRRAWCVRTATGIGTRRAPAGASARRPGQPSTPIRAPDALAGLDRAGLPGGGSSLRRRSPARSAHHRSRALLMPCCLRRPSGAWRLAKGRTTRSHRADRPPTRRRDAGRERIEQAILVLLARVRLRPPDAQPVESAERLEPVAAGVRPLDPRAVSAANASSRAPMEAADMPT